MSYDHEEQEQLAHLRELWARWGTLVSALVLAAGLALAGWRGWQWWQQRQAALAGAMYEHVGALLKAGNLQDAAPVVADLQQRYGSAVYAPMASLALAKAYAQAGKSAQAQTLLQWTDAHAARPADAALARLSLAALQADAGQYPAALASVSQAPTPAFDALFAARRGDVYALMGQPAKARDAYRQAMQQLAPDASLRQLVAFKLASVGGQGS